jgi:hypothetical protein
MKIFILVISSFIIFIIVKLYFVRLTKKNLKKLRDVFIKGQENITPQIILTKNSYTQYWEFKKPNFIVCNSFDFRNITSATIKQIDSKYSLELIPVKERLIVQSGYGTLTSQQCHSLDFDSLEHAINAKDIISKHISRLSKKKVKLKLKEIASVKISFYKRNHVEFDFKLDDIALFVHKWNESKKSKSNNVFFDTIILVCYKNGLTRSFWRSNNNIYENYDLIFETDDLSFLDLYFQQPEYEFHDENNIKSENTNIFAITR